ncbi:MAG: hypothetical protein ACAH21_14625 [Ramlibacter sp.]|nr:hypothetical protein [Ramlibacter sp.]
MSQLNAAASPAGQQAPQPGTSLSDLVNRLTQELTHARRSLAIATDRLGSTGRTLEGRTQELTEARSALALLLATLDAATDGMVAMGYFGRAMHYNTRFVEMWRLPADKLERLTDDALLTLQLAQVKNPGEFLALAAQRKAQPETEQSSVIEMTDGRIFECHVMPQRVAGKRVGTVTRFHDVTDREQLTRMVAALETQMPREVAEARASAY